MSLKSKAVSGVKWTSVSAVVNSTLQLLQIAILTRFLDKDDFGLMAMAIFVIGISRIFIDMGVSNAIIHNQNVNKLQLSTLFWLNIILGSLIFLIIISISPWVSVFYESPDLRDVINWVALSFLILPLGQQFDALLRKEFRFKSLAVRDVVARVIGFFVAIIVAYKGGGVYALVFSNLVATAVSTTLLVYLGFKDYRPKFLFSIRSIKEGGFLSFGLYQMGEKLINYFNSNFDTILIGKILGMDVLGLYNIAKTLAMKPYQIINPIITKVAFPTFAKVQNETERLKRAYLKVIEALANVNAMIYGLMIVLAHPLIEFAFGSDWLEAVPVFQLLSIVALCNSIGNPVGSLQLAKGKADWGFYWNLGMFIFMPITIWFGGKYGIYGVALALAIFKAVVTFLISWKLFINPLTKTSFQEYTWSFTKPILLATVTGVLPYFYINYNLKTNMFILLLIGGGIYFLLYGILNYLFNKSIILEFIKTVDLKAINKYKTYFQ